MSPEMLEMQMEMVNSEEIKVSREMMIKNDIWAFGCILLEILFYSSPAFYAIANCNQLKIIK
jgi:serine/threonine protein kinase